MPTTAASIPSTGTCTCPPRGPTRVVACPATQPTIWLAARSCAASSATEISGCKAAASDQVFGPFTATSTNRNACVVLPEPALRLPGLDVDPVTHCS